jgi:hypothetical protein
MLKHIDDIRKSAKERASRRWHNHAVEKAFKAAQKEATESAASLPKAIEPADILTQQKLVAEGTTKFESAFIKEMRAMLEGRSKVTVAMYLHSLEHRKRRLLRGKLRRLLVAQQEKKNERSLF